MSTACQQQPDWTVSVDGQPTKKRVLFIPASIRSHVIPTLYVADQLVSEYDVYYAVTNQVLADIVTENGYTPVMNDQFRVAVGMEHQFLVTKRRKTGFWQVLRSVYCNDLFYHRKQVLDELVTQIKPDVVIIDIFSSTDFLALYHHRARVKLLFCNPMLSTYRIGNLPIVSESVWPTIIAPETKPQTVNLKRLLRNPRAELYTNATRYQWRSLQQLAGLSSEHRAFDTPFTRLFENVPELVLAPLEFELLPKVRQPHQHYLGLCIREGRADTELDAHFAQQWPVIMTRKQTGERIIYCSFGTFYQGPDRTLLTFIENLLDAVGQLDKVQLICSVNQLVIETVKAWHYQPDCVHFFNRVPQLQVLQQTDVFITHGGLGSIKESIYYGVPMMVYPLDAHYDQPGNALKVEHHGLGLRGVFHSERVADLKSKLNRLINDMSFKIRLQQFKDETEVSRTRQMMDQTLLHLFTATRHEAESC